MTGFNQLITIFFIFAIQLTYSSSSSAQAFERFIISGVNLKNGKSEVEQAGGEFKKRLRYRKSFVAELSKSSIIKTCIIHK